MKYQCDDNFTEVNDVYNYFKQHGRLLANPKFKNVFVGLVS
jgi:hypothetical protein